MLIGNKWGVKLKDPEIRQIAYQSYCAHIAEGYPKFAWSFRQGEHTCCWKTMDRYIRENPNEFSSFLMEEANAKRAKYWLDEGKKLIAGKYKAGSPIVWATIMRNIFKDIGWDQIQYTNNVDPELTTHFSAVMNVIAAKQTPVAQASEPKPIDITPAGKEPVNEPLK